MPRPFSNAELQKIELLDSVGLTPREIASKIHRSREGVYKVIRKRKESGPLPVAAPVLDLNTEPRSQEPEPEEAEITIRIGVFHLTGRTTVARALALARDLDR